MKATERYLEEKKAFVPKKMDYAKFAEIRHEVRKGILAKMRYHQKVAAEVYGRPCYLTEAEVRALQILAKRKAEESDGAFREFAENVIVYSHRYKRRSKHKMIFRKDGTFENDFEEGFYDVNAKLAFEIL